MSFPALRLVPVTLVFAVACAAKSDGAADTGGTEAADDGADGADGTDGTDGSGGADGADGTDGTDGTDGADGTDGTDGTDGSGGSDGADGADGTDGTDGGTPALAAGTYSGFTDFDAVVPEVGLTDGCTGTGTLTVSEAGEIALVADCGGFTYISGTASIIGSGTMTSDLLGEGELASEGYFETAPFVIEFTDAGGPLDFVLSASPFGTFAGYSFGGTLQFTSRP
jgi:hypothetical protein